ncbi:hypothetical protein BC351_00835 [Paenibacillus ferrarius]|uniref:Uncharacterized protein n=1 Tax=Paenibacillus ferrarius TaxID=1469647 RepID=A0A1V4HSQ6_9BACL|nr:hypothetical protein BC351_00835 [Paenibacillus ferrarius]
MLKVMFMATDGDLLYSRDMSLEQLYALKFVDSIDIKTEAYTFSDIGYNVNLEEYYVWLK